MREEGTASKVSLALQADGEERGETATILVVDDEPGILRMLQTVLERRGFSVVTADSGKVALDRITTQPVDLVVLDIMMPELDGITTCRHLKADPALRHIPVILLTAKDSLRDQIFGLEMGADDYMTKPFSGEELVARINVQLRIRRMAREVMRRNRELAILNAVAEAVGRSLHRGEVLQAALEKIGEMEEVAAAYILLQDPEAGRMVVVGHNLTGPREEVLAPVEAKVLQAGLPHCYLNISKAPDLAPIPVPADAGSFLIVPLVSPGSAGEPTGDLTRWTGLLGLFSRPTTRFGEEEVRLFSAVGRQLTMALHNTHLFTSLEQQVRQTQALYHVSASVISSQAVDQVMRAIVERFLEAMQVDRCAITLLAGEVAGHLIVGYDRAKEDPWVHGVELSLDRHPEIRWVLENQQPLIIPDVAKEPLLEPVREILLSLQIRSALAVPLLAQEKSLGVVTLNSRGSVRHFTQGEIDFCQTLANQAALAITIARLYEETLKGKEYLGTILEINKKIGATPQISELLQTIAAEAARLLQVDGVGFRLVEGDALVLGAASGVARHIMLRPRLKIGESLSGQAAAENRPLIIPDIAAAPTWVKEHQEAALRQGIKSLMIVPVRMGDRVIGVLNIHTKANRQFTQRDVDVAMAFADQAAIAIERTRLLQETEVKAANLRAVIEVGKALSSALEVETVLQTIVVSAVEVMKAHSGNVMLLDETGEELHWKAQVGFPEVYRQVGRSKVGASLAGCVITEGKPLAVMDRTLDPRTAHPDLAREHGLISFLGVPVRSKDRTVGVITISTKEPRRFTDEETSLLSTFADQAAIAIENARLFAETRRLANTDELTGLYNHRHFYHLCDAEVNRSRRYGRPLSLIMLDLDHFKAFNDQHGHLMGDEALRRLAQILRRNSRGVDMVARYGGEEFAVILPETDLDQATIQAERIRAGVAEYPWPQGRLTISLGVASLTSEMTKVEELVHVADQALYQAKAGGRNRVSSSKTPSR